MYFLFLPDCDDLSSVQRNAVHLRDKDGGHSFIEGGTVHVDSGANWQHETSDTLIDAVVFLETSERDRESGGAKNKKMYQKLKKDMVENSAQS